MREPLAADYEVRVGKTVLATLQPDGSILLKNGQTLRSTDFHHTFKSGGHISVTSAGGQANVEIARPGRTTRHFEYQGICWYENLPDPAAVGASATEGDADRDQPVGDLPHPEKHRTMVLWLMGIAAVLVAGVGVSLHIHDSDQVHVSESRNVANTNDNEETEREPGSNDGDFSFEPTTTMEELSETTSMVKDLVAAVPQTGSTYVKTHQQESRTKLTLTPVQHKDFNEYLDRLDGYTTDILTFSQFVRGQRAGLVSIDTEIERLFRGNDQASRQMKHDYLTLMQWKPDANHEFLKAQCKVAGDSIDTGRPLIVEETHRKMLREELTRADLLQHVVALRCLQFELKQWTHVGEQLGGILPHLPPELILEQGIDLSRPESKAADSDFVASLKQDAQFLERQLGEVIDGAEVPWNAKDVESWLANYSTWSRKDRSRLGRLSSRSGTAEHQASTAALSLLRSAPPETLEGRRAKARVYKLLVDHWHSVDLGGNDDFHAEMRQEYTSLVTNLNEAYAEVNAAQQRQNALDEVRRKQQRLRGETPDAPQRHTSGISKSGFNPRHGNLVDRETAKQNGTSELTREDYHAEGKVLQWMTTGWHDRLRSGRTDFYYEFKDAQKAELQARYRIVQAEIHKRLNPFNR